MKSEYLFCLYKQYCQSIGMKYDIYNIFSDANFINWVSGLYKQTKLYGNYLLSLDVDLACDSVIEINKGKYDSLGLNLVSVISNYAETLGLKNGSLLIRNNEPLVLISSSIFEVDSCDLFLTHNPYDMCDIAMFRQLYDIGLNICLGMYGQISDKDMEVKLKNLHSLAKDSIDDLRLYYDTLGNDYFACIKSARKIKRKVK